MLARKTRNEHRRDWQATNYLEQHADHPPDAKAEARRRRMERMQRDRIARRNAPLLKRIRKQER
jgi:hypothetical protein